MGGGCDKPTLFIQKCNEDGKRVFLSSVENKTASAIKGHKEREYEKAKKDVYVDKKHKLWRMVFKFDESLNNRSAQDNEIQRDAFINAIMDTAEKQDIRVIIRNVRRRRLTSRRR